MSPVKKKHLQAQTDKEKLALYLPAQHQTLKLCYCKFGRHQHVAVAFQIIIAPAYILNRNMIHFLFNKLELHYIYTFSLNWINEGLVWIVWRGKKWSPELLLACIQCNKHAYHSWPLGSSPLSNLPSRRGAMSHRIKSHLLLLQCVQAVSIEYRGYTLHHKTKHWGGQGYRKDPTKTNKFVFCWSVSSDSL